jgi:EmrB/QacA subfamily drug resistance transporter
MVTPLITAAQPATTSPHPRRWLALGFVVLAQLMIVIDSTIVNVALPSAQAGLHISGADRQWAVTAYTLAFGGLLLAGGRIADYSGRKRALVTGLLGFGAASALGGLAADGAMLFAARALQGAFAALMAPAALSLIAVIFTDHRERARAFGVYGGASGVGAALGLVLGGVLTEYASWRWCLIVNVPVAVIAASGALYCVPESRRRGRTRYDVPGVCTAIGAVVCIVYGVTKAAEDGWGTAPVIALLTAGVVLLAAFAIIEARAEIPVLPLRVVMDRNRGGSLAVMFLTGAATMGMFLLLTYYLQDALHYSALKTGFAFAPYAIALVAAAQIAGRLLPKAGPRVMITAGLCLALAGLTWDTQIPARSEFWGLVLPAELLLGFGVGLVFVAIPSTVMSGVDLADSGAAGGLVNTTQQLGGAIGVAVLNTVAASASLSYAASHRHSVAAVLVHGYAQAYVAGSIILGAAVVVAVALIRPASKAPPLPDDGDRKRPILSVRNPARAAEPAMNRQAIHANWPAGESVSAWASVCGRVARGEGSGSGG